MRRGGEVVPLLAAGAVAAAVALGGAFDPYERLVVGAAVAVLAGWAAVAVARSPSAEEWVALAVIGWGGVSATVVSGYPLAARQALGGWLVAWVIWLIAARTSPAWRRSVGMVVAAAAIVVAVAVIIECAAASRLRMGGLFVNPNVAAAMLVPAIPTVRALVGGGARWGVVAPVTAVLAAGILMTGSRAGALALLVVVGLMLPRGRLRAFGIAGVLVVAAAFLLARFVDRPDSLAWHRVEIWRALWLLVVQSPLMGVGPGWLEEATGVVRIAHEGGIARWGHVIGSAESTPYGVLVRTGFVGLGLALAAIALWLRRSLQKGGVAASSARAVLAGIVAVALFHDLLDVDVVLWWWALLLGAAGAMVRDPEDTVRSVGLARRVTTGLALAFLVLWTIATPALARHLWWSGTSSRELAERAEQVEPRYSEPVEWRVAQLLAEPEWSWEDGAAAISWSRRAVEIHRGSADAWTRLGDVHARIATELGPWPDALAGAREGFGHATGLEPHLPWAWLRWAVFERSVGQLDDARRLAERAVSEEPNFVRGWLFLARVELDAGDEAGARSAFKRAQAAATLASGRELTDYERDLLSASAWQVEDVVRSLAGADTPGG